MGSIISSFTDLNAWKEAHALVLGVYDTTKYFPKEEQFGLTQQIRRAAVSISSNLAEGFSKTYAKEKAQFYTTALASLTEAQNQLLIARDVSYISQQQFLSLERRTIAVSKLINGLRKSVQSRSP